MVGQLVPVEGNVSRRSGLSIGRYHQHSQEVLDFSKSPVEYLKVTISLAFVILCRSEGGTLLVTFLAVDILAVGIIDRKGTLALSIFGILELSCGSLKLLMQRRVTYLGPVEEHGSSVFDYDVACLS